MLGVPPFFYGRDWLYSISTKFLHVFLVITDYSLLAETELTSHTTGCRITL